MSQLLQVHINNRLLKSGSGENSPASPGMINSPVALSPMSVGPSSPQGIPIHRRSMQETWIVNPNTSFTSGNNWSGNITLDGSVDSPVDLGGGLNMHQESDSLQGDSSMLGKLTMAVDEDDIFKVEKSEFHLGPTLAELNASDADTLLDGLNFDDLYWPADSTFHAVSEATLSPQTAPPLLNLIPTDSELDLMVPSSSFPPMGSKLAVPATSVPTSQSLLEQSILPTPLTVSAEVATTSAALTNPPTSR